VVEAVESDDHPFVVGVQWHPELAALSDDRQRRLFEALLANRKAVAPAERRYGGPEGNGEAPPAPEPGVRPSAVER
jgi:putative glutamine amidotransferase